MSWAASAYWLWSQHGSTPPRIGMEIGASLVRHDRYLLQTFNTRISRIPFSEVLEDLSDPRRPDAVLSNRRPGEGATTMRGSCRHIRAVAQSCPWQDPRIFSTFENGYLRSISPSGRPGRPHALRPHWFQNYPTIRDRKEFDETRHEATVDTVRHEKLVCVRVGRGTDVPVSSLLSRMGAFAELREVSDQDFPHADLLQPRVEHPDNHARDVVMLSRTAYERVH